MFNMVYVPCVKPYTVRRYRTFGGGAHAVRTVVIVSSSNITGAERSRRTHLFRDQLGRADAGSWQIADRGATRKAAAGGTSVGDFRVHFVVEL